MCVSMIHYSRFSQNNVFWEAPPMQHFLHFPSQDAIARWRWPASMRLHWPSASGETSILFHYKKAYTILDHIRITIQHVIIHK